MMKGICAAFAFAALAASWQGPAQAAFPDQPIKLVVPFAPGATIGPLAQLVSEQLSSDLGTPVYTEFKTGAGGNIGADIVAKSPGDGYTLLLGTISILTINPSLYPDLPFDPVKDFKPVSMLVTTQNILVVNPESKINRWRIWPTMPGNILARPPSARPAPAAPCTWRANCSAPRRRSR